jgi:hypothetical protein
MWLGSNRFIFSPFFYPPNKNGNSNINYLIPQIKSTLALAVYPVRIELPPATSWWILY